VGGGAPAERRARLPRLTGERPLPGATPDSLLALHAAGYREVRARLGRGSVLDAGCGVGYESSLLQAPGRTVVGVDYDPAAAGEAARIHGLTACCCDAAGLALRDRTFDWACSSHVIEHFDTPARHAAELARVLRRSGTAFFLTPNAPFDYENPFHLVEFSQASLASLLSEHFAEVWVGGLQPSARAEADFVARRAKATRLLGIADPFDLRHRLPRRWWTAAYAHGLPVAYRLMARADTGGATGITADDFTVVETVDDATAVLLAVATRPRRRPGAPA
jgi:SAM-dependent methyltransferase